MVEDGAPGTGAEWIAAAVVVESPLAAGGGDVLFVIAFKIKKRISSLRCDDLKLWE